MKKKEEIKELAEILSPKSFREIAGLLDNVDRFIVRVTRQKQDDRDQRLLRKFANSFEKILRDKK